MSTLYVSDLDGTLLRSDEGMSAYTCRIVNGLVERGAAFTYATARSLATARKVTAGLTAAFPVIVNNGVFVRDNATGEYLLENYFPAEAAERLIRDLLAGGIRPIVYSRIGGEEKFSYLPAQVNPATEAFLRTRRGDSRDRPVEDPEELLAGSVFYVTCVDETERLRPYAERCGRIHRVHFAREYYSGDWFLEIMPQTATKANAAKALAAKLGCGRVVAFGDGINDLDLFHIADEAYATANADPSLKAAATGVIGSNNEDGVARWLEARFSHEEAST